MTPPWLPANNMGEAFALLQLDLVSISILG